MISTIPPIPPLLMRRKRSFWKAILITICLIILLILLSVAGSIIGGIFLGTSMFTFMEKSSELRIISDTDTFQVKTLEVKSSKNFFEEKVRVRCMQDMNVNLWVTDLTQVGIFKTNGPEGEIVYREGEPHIFGQSAAIQAKDGFSTYEILFRITTSSTNTEWHCKADDGSCDTAISTPLTVSNVQTNWTGSYQRGTGLPLCNLGDYKILLSIK